MKNRHYDRQYNLGISLSRRKNFGPEQPPERNKNITPKQLELPPDKVVTDALDGGTD